MDFVRIMNKFVSKELIVYGQKVNNVWECINLTCRSLPLEEPECVAYELKIVEVHNPTYQFGDAT